MSLAQMIAVVAVELQIDFVVAAYLAGRTWSFDFQKYLTDLMLLQDVGHLHLDV